jgi:3-hydroxybutyryl-CoA dehydratase
MLDRYFDEIEVGDISHSRGRTITETDIVNFCMFSGDWYVIHSNAEFAKQTPFGQRIAHGLLVLSAASGLSEIKPGTVVAFYGMDKVRFVAPTFIGDTIHVETEVIDKEDRGDQGIVTLKQQIKKQTGEPVVVSTLRLLMNKRPKTQ